jgi:type IV secretory pathway protease TraF
LTAEQVDSYGTPSSSNPITLAADQYPVLGDNSRSSRDARFFGPIPADSVKGVVRCTYWPPGRIRTFVPPDEPANR